MSFPALMLCLLGGRFVGLFSIMFASDFETGKSIRACNASFESGAGRWFLGLETFVVGRTQRGRSRKLRFFGAGIEGVRFATFVERLFHHVVLAVQKITHFFVNLGFKLFKKVCRQNFNQITQKFYCRFLIY